MRLVLVYLSLGLVFFALPAAATYTFSSCLLPTFISQGLLTSLLSLLLVNSNSACQSTCGTNGYAYSYFKPTVGLQLAACYCSAAPPNITYIDTATDAAADCPTSDYTGSLLNTTWTFGSCYSTFTNLNVVSTGTYATISQCLNSCATANTPVAFVTPNTAGTWGCSCDKGYSASSAVACGKGVGMLYTQTVTTSTAKSRKRELEEQAKVQEKRTDIFCPKGLTPCRVADQLDAYECLDPRTELESCGGCTHGIYGSQDIAPPGIDCSTLPGTTMGGTTCEHGRCVSIRCEHGYKLTPSGECVFNHHQTHSASPQTSNATLSANRRDLNYSFLEENGEDEHDMTTIGVTVPLDGLVSLRPLWERTKGR